jgi:hypothetical protein
MLDSFVFCNRSGKGLRANLVWTTSQQPTGITARRKFGLTRQFLSTSKVTVDLPPSAQQRVYVSCGGPLPMSSTFLNFVPVSGTKTRFETAAAINTGRCRQWGGFVDSDDLNIKADKND